MRANGCRECTECEGAPDHHWLPNGGAALDDDTEDGDGPMYVCKHCEATTDEDVEDEHDDEPYDYHDGPLSNYDANDGTEGSR